MELDAAGCGSWYCVAVATEVSFRRLMLSLMTTYEVNDDTDAADLDVRSVMELDAAGAEAGLRC